MSGIPLKTIRTQNSRIRRLEDYIGLQGPSSGGGGGGGGGGGEFYFQSTAPATTTAGARWLHSLTGIEYTLVNDGNSTQWVELGPDCGGGEPLTLIPNLPGVLRNIWVDSSGGMSGGILDGINAAPGISDTGDHIRRTWRRRNENQNNTSFSCVNAYYSAYGGVHNAQYSSFLISWVFGFDGTSTFYRAAQGCFAGLANTLPTGALTGVTGNSFWTATNVNTLIGIGLDFGTNSWVAVTKNGTGGAITTVPMSSVTRVVGSVYKAVVWKEGGNNAINFYLERTDPATGLVVQSQTVQIPFSACPAERVRPWLAIANSVTNAHECSIDIHGSIWYTHWTGVDQITGSAGGLGGLVQYQDEGVNLGSAGTVDTVDFTGSGVTASRSGNKVTVNVPGSTPFDAFLNTSFHGTFAAANNTGQVTREVNHAAPSVTGTWAQPGFVASNVGQMVRTVASAGSGSLVLNFGNDFYQMPTSQARITERWRVGTAADHTNTPSFFCGVVLTGTGVGGSPRTDTGQRRIGIAANQSDADYTFVTCDGTSVTQVAMTGFTRAANRLIDLQMVYPGNGTVVVTATYYDYSLNVLATFSQTITTTLPVGFSLIGVFGGLFFAPTGSLMFMHRALWRQLN